MADKRLPSEEAERGRALLDSGDYSDLMLEIVHESGNRSLPVHRCILAIASSVWASAIKWADQGSLKVSEFPFATIHSVIFYAYTRHVQFESLSHCKNVLQASHFYDMPSLGIECGNFIKGLFEMNHLNLTEVIDLLNGASLYDSDIISKECIAYVDDNMKKVFESEEFLTLSTDALNLLLSNHKHLPVEKYMMQAVMKWAINKLPSSGCKNLREFFVTTKIMANLRLNKFTTEELKDLNQDYPNVFTGEGPYEIDYLNPSHLSLVKSEEPLNENLINKVIVLCPPMIICEEFYNNGPDIMFPITSVKLEPRHNYHNYRLTGSYEEKISIAIDDFVACFDGVVGERKGLTLQFSSPVNLILKHGKNFNFFIRLDKRGVYFKNSTFSLIGDGFYRRQPGLISDLNNFFDKSSTSTQTEEE